MILPVICAVVVSVVAGVATESFFWGSMFFLVSLLLINKLESK